MTIYALPILCAFALGIFLLENLIPARPRKAKIEWYVRAGLVTGFQLLVFSIVESAWGKLFNGVSIFKLDGKITDLQGAVLAYFIFTFVVYWWHRLRHESIQFYKKIGSPNVHEPLKTLMGNSEIVYIHDLGISPDYRGDVPLERLVIPPVMRVVTEFKWPTILTKNLSGTSTSGVVDIQYTL